MTVLTPDEERRCREMATVCSTNNWSASGRDGVRYNGSTPEEALRHAKAAKAPEPIIVGPLSPLPDSVSLKEKIG